ncbi:MAG: hypothetical protein V1889_00585 [archaeon]
MLNKKGDLTTGEILEIVLAAAVVLVLAFLLYKLISPSFDVGEKTAESYRDSFLAQVGVADSGSVGEFSIWQVSEKNDFYLVYFGDKKNVESRFFCLDNNVNKFCICYGRKGKYECSRCGELGRSALMDGASSWVLNPIDKIEIKLKEDVYEINKI